MYNDDSRGDAESSDYAGQSQERDMNTTPNGAADTSSNTEMNAAIARAVHQCIVCNKIFVSLKGLQQHAVIHTDQKPFVCDICGKAFRFKSNLFEHRSVHSGFTPHQCPFCGKTCRLKGNLKKHLKTHVNTPDELQDAWRPFASNRRPPMQIPDDAIVVRSTGEPIYHAPSRPRRRKLGLGDAHTWIEKIEKGDLLPSMKLNDKLTRLEELLTQAESTFSSLQECLEVMRAIPLERFDCPLCTQMFVSRLEAQEHMSTEHSNERLNFYCEACLVQFNDRKQYEQHEQYHQRVRVLLNGGDLKWARDPQPLSAEECLRRVHKRARGEPVEGDERLQVQIQRQPNTRQNEPSEDSQDSSMQRSADESAQLLNEQPKANAVNATF